MVKEVSYTVTEKGTVTIPAHIRAKYGLRKGSKVKFVETEEGILLIPIIPLEELFGVDRDKKNVVCEIIKEIQEERMGEIAEE